MYRVVTDCLVNQTIRATRTNMLRHLLLMATQYMVLNEAQYIATRGNVLADALPYFPSTTITKLAPHPIYPGCNY